MKNRKTIPILIVSFLMISPLFQGGLFGISFQGLDLADGGRLLFRTDFESEYALFLTRLSDMSMRQITAFPEKLEVVEDGNTVLVSSRFGLVRIPAMGGLPTPLPGFPSFTTGDIPVKGRLPEFSASADGRWLLYVEPTGPAYGNLVLIEIASGAKRVISEKVELPAEDFPALWNPNSRFFVYAKAGRLYYFPILNDSAAVGDERYRLIGEGRITSGLWGQDGDFFYFRGNTLYRVVNLNLFTRTIYGDFLSIGSVAGTLPFEFNPGFDRFWVAPDGRSVLINKNGKSLFYFPLGENKADGSVLPHITLPNGAGGLKVLWPSSGQAVVISSLPKSAMVWRFEIDGSTVKTSIPQEIPASSNAALSPDGKRVLFWGEKGLELWDFTAWRLTLVLSREQVFSCAWLNNQEIAVGNSRFIERYNVLSRSSSRRILCLSGADEFGFEEGSAPLQILVRTGTEWFVNDGNNPWTPVTNPRRRNASLSSENYRVYLETQPSGPFKNYPMVRNYLTAGTVSVVSNHSVNEVFVPGRHIVELPIALCFDLYDDDAGLSQVMDSLRRFNIKATFFMNGDFIRRNPVSVAAIIEAGHEAASLFYAPIDLSDSRYRVNSEYITQGLARNEDEFFRVTGKELGLLWHPPFFRTSGAVNAAAAAAGYITVTRDVDPGDWMAGDEAVRLGIRQSSASDMIERIMAGKKHGAVIPIRLGLVHGGRDDYLFQRIDVLLDALVRSGCEIVPVSAVFSK